MDYQYHRGEVHYFSHKDNKNKADSLYTYYKSAIQYFEQQYDQPLPIKFVFIRHQDYNNLRLQFQPYYGIPLIEDDYLLIPIEVSGLVFNYLEMKLKNGPAKHLHTFSQLRPMDAHGVSGAMHISAVHEIGRYFQQVSELPTEPKWVNDFISSYLMIDFLHNNYPEYNTFINAFCHLVTHQISPSYKNLKVFEEKYKRDEHSYSWYQSKIHLAAYLLYLEEGIDFFFQYREHAQQENQLLMHPLDTIVRQFNP
jgi:hypothetical protein